MKSASLVSTCAGLFPIACTVLRSAWSDAAEAEGVVQVRDDRQRLFTLFDFDDVYWENFEVPASIAALSSELYACEAECRWDDLFVAVVGQMAGAVTPLWVVDDNGDVWDASQLDDDFHLV